MNSTFSSGAEARSAIYGPLLGPGAGHLPPTEPVAAAPAEGGSTPALLAGGVLGGAVGLVAGGLVGALIGGNLCSDSPAVSDPCERELFTGLGLGALIGEAAMLPLGVHLADRRRGSYPKMALTSLAISGAAVGLVRATGNSVAGPIIISSALLQLVTSIAIERRTAER